MEINKKPVRLLRVVIAATIAELIPLIILVALITLHTYGAQEAEGTEDMAWQVRGYVWPVTGALATLGMGFWAARKQTNAWVLHGTLTGVLVVILDLIIFLGQDTEFDLGFGLGLPAKLLAGVIGGYLAKNRYQHLPADARKSHRLV